MTWVRFTSRRWVPTICDGCGLEFGELEYWKYVPNKRGNDGKRYHPKCVPQQKQEPERDDES